MWKIVPIPVEQRSVRSEEFDGRPLWRMAVLDRNGKEWEGPIFLSVEDLDALIVEANVAKLWAGQ